MNEPNDTAQEGFDQLKRNLEVRYPEDSDLSLDEFLNVESLLALAVRVCGPGADPRKADRLLSNYQLIRPETIGADGHLMQMARRHLFSLASSTAWRRLLGLYERAEYERYRFFDIANGGMALRGCMVQLYKNDMRVNLPAPLHLAEQVEEYIWDWELTGRR